MFRAQHQQGHWQGSKLGRPVRCGAAFSSIRASELVDVQSFLFYFLLSHNSAVLSAKKYASAGNETGELARGALLRRIKQQVGDKPSRGNAMRQSGTRGP